MANSNPTGRTPSLSMADFNARAKRIAADTGEVEKGSARRAPPSRFRKDSSQAPKPAAPANENS